MTVLQMRFVQQADGMMIHVENLAREDAKRAEVEYANRFEDMVKITAREMHGGVDQESIPQRDPEEHDDA